MYYRVRAVSFSLGFSLFFFPSPLQAPHTPGAPWLLPSSSQLQTSLSPSMLS